MSCSKLSKTYMKSPKFGCDTSLSCCPRKPVSYHRKCFTQLDTCGGNPEITGGEVIIYVNAGSGNDSNTGDSPTNAMKTLDGAIARLGSNTGTVGIIQLIGTTEFILDNYVFDARDLENKYTRVIIRGTRSDIVNGTATTITIDHGPDIPTITNNPPSETGSEYRWQTINASGLQAGFYNEKYLENLTNGHTYMIKENTATTISVLSADDENPDFNTILPIEVGDKYQIFTISNVIRFTGEVRIDTNINGFVTFDSVRITPTDIYAKLITPRGLNSINLFGCELFFTSALPSGIGKNTLPGSYLFEGCLIKNYSADLAVNVQNHNNGMSNHVHISCIFDNVIWTFLGYSVVNDCWFKDSRASTAGLVYIRYSLFESSVNAVNGSTLETNNGMARLSACSFVDTRSYNANNFAVESDAEGVLTLANNRIITNSSAIKQNIRPSSVLIDRSSITITDVGYFVLSDRNAKFTSQSSIWISTDATSTTSLFRLLDTNATFNIVTVNRNSQNQTVFHASYATKLRLNDIGIGGINLTTVPLILLNSGSHGVGEDIASTVPGSVLRVGGNSPGGLTTQNDLASVTSENCFWMQV